MRLRFLGGLRAAGRGQDLGNQDSSRVPTEGEPRQEGEESSDSSQAPSAAFTVEVRNPECKKRHGCNAVGSAELQRLLFGNCSGRHEEDDGDNNNHHLQTFSCSS